MSFTLRFDIEPVAKGRPRLGRGHTFTPAKTRRYENTLKILARKEWGPLPPLMGPLLVSIVFTLKRPARPKFAQPAVRPDLDNFLKGVFDALNGVTWVDDGQIVGLMARKVYAQKSDKPGIEVSLMSVNAAEELAASDSSDIWGAHGSEWPSFAKSKARPVSCTA